MGTISSNHYGDFEFGIDEWSSYESVAKKLVKKIKLLLKSETEIPPAYIRIVPNPN